MGHWYTFLHTQEENFPLEQEKKWKLNYLNMTMTLKVMENVFNSFNGFFLLFSRGLRLSKELKCACVKLFYLKLLNFYEVRGKLRKNGKNSWGSRLGERKNLMKIFIGKIGKFSRVFTKKIVEKNFLENFNEKLFRKFLFIIFKKKLKNSRKILMKYLGKTSWKI